jgi:ribosomal-protein-alanine N-acetyltransferase
MICRDCSFVTQRLLVKEWHSLSAEDWERQPLGHVVAALLTEPVTRWLPTSWQGPYTKERARRWIEERDGEGATLLIIDRSSGAPVGLVILSESNSQDVAGGIEVRLGYLLAEPAWGKGIASELLSGFVAWCRQQAAISRIVGGVDPDNVASQRVLEKNGFLRVQNTDQVTQDEWIFRLNLRS